MGRQELIEQYGQQVVEKYHNNAINYAKRRGFEPNNIWALTRSFIRKDYADPKPENNNRDEAPLPYNPQTDYAEHYDDAMLVLEYMNKRDAKIYDDFERYDWNGHTEWRGIAELISRGETAEELIDYCNRQWPCHTKLCRAVGLKLHRIGGGA